MLNTSLHLFISVFLEATTSSSGTGPVSSHQSVSTSFGVKPISSQQESPITINSGCGAKINETHQIRGNAGEGNLQMQKSASPVNEINCPSSVTGTKSQEKTGLVEAKVASSGTGSLEISSKYSMVVVTPQRPFHATL